MRVRCTHCGRKMWPRRKARGCTIAGVVFYVHKACVFPWWKAERKAIAEQLNRDMDMMRHVHDISRGPA